MSEKFKIGAKTLKALVTAGDPLAYWKSKLSPGLFKGEEKEIFAFIQTHYEKFKSLPHPDTLLAAFPDIAELPIPEKPAYYVDKLEERYCYNLINDGNLASQEVLKNNPSAIEAAENILRDTLQAIAKQKYRHRMLDVGAEGGMLLHDTYHKKFGDIVPVDFGWQYMDERTGGVLPGDLVSIVGRPAQGKTWLLLYIAVYNWLAGKKVLFVSMEMSVTAITQRIGAMYAHLPVQQLKLSQFSTPTEKSFFGKIGAMALEKGKLYVVDGNLAATVDDIFDLADHLDVDMVCIDGGYLVRHKNPRLNRFERVAENVEAMKRYCDERPTFASWQFNRAASKKNKKQGEKETLEDIGYSDAIGQVSSIVIGLMQEESVETMLKRRADLLKGRNGEIGGFDIKWNFTAMDFAQIVPGDATAEAEETLDYV